MATAFVKTYDQVGKKEDVSDFISNLSPTETTCVTSFGTSSVDNILYQWQEDALDPAADNAQLEGADAPAANQVPTVMRDNTTRILAKTVKTSGSADRMSTYGRAKEFAFQMVKKGKEIKLDLEYAMCGVSQAKVVGDSVTARRFANIYTQIASANVLANGGTPRAFSEALLLNGMEQLYDVNGKATVLMIRPADARVVAGFAYKLQGTDAPAQQRMLGGGDKKVVNVVSYYVTPWEDELRVVKNRLLAKGEAHGAVFLYDPSNWKRAIFRDWFKKPLPSGGDYQASEIIGEFGLKHANQSASALITDLS